MPVAFDPAKDEINRAKHGISLGRAEDLEIAVVIEDDRFEYGEARYRAFGFIDARPHCLVFTAKEGDVRAISLRRAHWKEFNRYVR